MTKKPFMSATITLSKAKFREMVHEMVDYTLSDKFSEEVLTKAGVSSKTIVSLLEKDETYLANFQKQFSSVMKDVVNDHIVGDPDGYDFYEVTSHLLDEIYERLEDLQTEYDEQQEILAEAQHTPQVKKAISLLRSKGFKVQNPHDEYF